MDGPVDNEAPSSEVEINGVQCSTEDAPSAPAFTEDKLASIRQQCEFYFSDANILKDQYLLNLVKNSTDGWVKLEVIEKFKKMQKLTQDHEAIVSALSTSDKLEISPDGLSVRRLNPLPEWDRSVYFRSIIITDLPEGTTLNHDLLLKLFSTENSTPPLLIRIFSPNKKIPSDLKRSMTYHPQLGVKLSAVVEFSNKTEAANAIALVRQRWPTAYVHLLSFGSKKPNDTKVKPKAEHPESDDPLPTTRRPLFLLKPSEETAKVIHIREPTKPPEEGSVGFMPNWRELIRFERLLLSPVASGGSILNPEAPPFVPKTVAVEADSAES